jgi:hypothetical protein
VAPPQILILQDRLAIAYLLAATANEPLRTQSTQDAHRIVLALGLKFGLAQARERSKRSETLTHLALDVLAAGGSVSLRPLPKGRELDPLPEPPNPPSD